MGDRSGNRSSGGRPRRPAAGPGGSPQRGAGRSGGGQRRQPTRSKTTGPTRPARPTRPSEPTEAVQGPQVDEDVTWQDLDRQTRAALRSLPKAMAERVGAHLAMAGLLVDTDPEQAREHTDVARRLAGRVAVVREASALTAYACGDFDAALQELRAYRRMSGDQTHLPLMADCERGLGRPERALEMAASPEAKTLPDDVARELRIVTAGARCDLGQTDAALTLLAADPALGAKFPSVPPSVLRLRYAYADTLEQLGRSAEAVEWFAGVAAADSEGLTDAVERVAGAAGGTAPPPSRT